MQEEMRATILKSLKATTPEEQQKILDSVSERLSQIKQK